MAETKQDAQRRAGLLPQGVTDATDKESKGTKNDSDAKLPVARPATEGDPPGSHASRTSAGSR